ncbi:MCM2/3/5 family-domain-containing protein [Trypanosoma cruzi]|nr:MCM2/3/5 family-domain-containing protein [Trypanosoma cruzi]
MSPHRKRPREEKRTRHTHESDDDRDGEDEEELGEDLFGENYERDYLNPEDESELAEDDVADDDDWIDDTSDVSVISESGRLAVDALLDRRKEMEQRLREEQRELEKGVFSDVDDEESVISAESDYYNAADPDDDGGEEDEAGRNRVGLNNGEDGDADYTGGHKDDGVYVRGDMEAMDFDWRRPQCDLIEWLAQELPRRVVKNRIYNFYLNYVENGVSVYEQKVNLMTRENEQSFELSYSHLGRAYDSVLALWLVDVPDLMIELLEDAANYFVFRLFPHYQKVHRRILVRICDLPLCDPIRDFRQIHMNVLVRVEGVVIRRSPVYPQMQAVRYDCVRCSYIIGPIYQRGDKEQRVSMCPSCHSKGPFRVNMTLTEYRNHQTVLLQESPGKVPPGRLPRSLEVILTNDLIDRANPGEEVDVTGIYRNNFDPLLNSRQGFPVFTTVLHANNVVRRSAEVGSFRLPDDERARIMELAKHPNLKRKMLRSIAPSIHGRDDIKLGLLLAMLGGVPKDVGGDQSHRIRGDINVLLVGDPGCAKSQFLKFVEKTANRAVFTTGRGSTAVGLTASVHKDSVTGDFVLEGGALVIADRGICLIDEFDKMSDQDRTSIHEAMEQQTISVARGGIVTTLSARCSIAAAANPIGGRYDPSLSFDANVNLTTPILSRFDLLFVVRDEVNVELDEKLATFICHSHIRNHPRSQEENKRTERELHQQLSRLRYALENASTEEERHVIEGQLQELRHHLQEKPREEDEDPSSNKPLPQPLLRKYILYAKAHCHPRVSNIDANTIARLYTELRQESKHGGVAITVRHMESVIRLAEAHARLYLRDFVRDEDVNAAISLFLRCFIQTQKYSLRSAMENRFRKYLDSEMEPIPLIQHHIRVAVHSIRAFERQISGGVEPTKVRIDVAQLEHCTANISREALNTFFESEEFKKDYKLICDPATGAILQIEHSLV